MQLLSIRTAGKLSCAEPPASNPHQYSDDLIDAYLAVEVWTDFTLSMRLEGWNSRAVFANPPWHAHEFVVKDGDGPCSPPGRTSSWAVHSPEQRFLLRRRRLRLSILTVVLRARQLQS